MATVDQSIERVRTFARQMGWKPIQYAEKANLHKNSLRNMFEPDWNPTSETLRKLEGLIPADWTPADAASALNEAIMQACGPEGLAARCNVEIAEVADWIAKRRVGDDYVLIVEDVTGVSRHWQRPDLYPEPQQKRA